MTDRTPSGVPRFKRVASGTSSSDALGPTLRVEGILSVADILTLREMAAPELVKYARLWEFVRHILYVVVPLVILIVWPPTLTQREFWYVLGSLLLGLSISVFLEPIFFRRALIIAPPVETPVSFEISDHGLTYRQADYRSNLNWAALTAVVREPQWIIIKFNELASFGIPTHLFGNVDERDLWLAELARRLGPDRNIESRLNIDF